MSCAIERGNFPPLEAPLEDNAVTTQTPLDKYLTKHPGKHRPRRGDRSLNRKQVAAIRKPGANVSALAREYGVSPVAGWKAKHRITYRDWL